MTRRGVAVLGSTGSIGTTALRVLSRQRDRFDVTAVHERPGTMPNVNNEGFTMAPAAECVGGVKPVFWAEDELHLWEEPDDPSDHDLPDDVWAERMRHVA